MRTPELMHPLALFPNSHSGNSNPISPHSLRFWSLQNGTWGYSHSSQAAKLYPSIYHH